MGIVYMGSFCIDRSWKNRLFSLLSNIFDSVTIRYRICIGNDFSPHHHDHEFFFCICPRLCEIEQLWYRKRLKGQLKIKHSVGCTPFDLWKGTWMFLEERETLQVLNPPPEPISPRYLMVRVLLYIMWSFKARGHSKTPYILFLLETTLIQHRLRDLNITHEYLRWWRTLLYLLILSRGIKWAT